MSLKEIKDIALSTYYITMAVVFVCLATWLIFGVIITEPICD
jgi:hypothetical protein